MEPSLLLSNHANDDPLRLWKITDEEEADIVDPEATQAVEFIGDNDPIDVAMPEAESSKRKK